MIDPSSITVSLDVAKKLAKAGWPQHEAIFCWWQRLGHEDFELGYRAELLNQHLAAPTAEEIISEICKRTNWPMELLLSNVAGAMHSQEYKGTLADFLAEIFCNSIRMGTIPASPPSS